jgi:hypothetical protein
MAVSGKSATLIDAHGLEVRLPRHVSALVDGGNADIKQDGDALVASAMAEWKTEDPTRLIVVTAIGGELVQETERSSDIQRNLCDGINHPRPEFNTGPERWHHEFPLAVLPGQGFVVSWHPATKAS